MTLLVRQAPSVPKVHGTHNPHRASNDFRTFVKATEFGRDTINEDALISSGQPFRMNRSILTRFHRV